MQSRIVQDKSFEGPDLGETDEFEIGELGYCIRLQGLSKCNQIF